MTIHNRYIVVAGGWGSRDVKYLTSVEIIDTVQESSPYIFPGPPLNVPRQYFGMTVIGSYIYVVGGTSHDSSAEALRSIENLKVRDSRDEKTSINGTSVSPPSLSWTKHQELALSEPRYAHAVARVGSCLVVSGGCPCFGQPPLRSVEVMDTKRNKVWKIVPELTVPRIWHTMVSISTGIVCISGGRRVDFCEILSLMDKNSVVFRNLLLGKNGTHPCLKKM